MTNTHKERLQATPIVQNHAKVACGGPLVTTSSSNNPCPIVLPIEIVGLVMTFLDGNSLLNCACVSVAWESMAQHRDIWKTICLEKWPTLQRQTLSQLPGAPDYDVRLLNNTRLSLIFINSSSVCTEVHGKNVSSNKIERTNERKLLFRSIISQNETKIASYLTRFISENMFSVSGSFHVVILMKWNMLVVYCLSISS